MSLDRSLVAVVKVDHARHPKRAPFDPSGLFPELPASKPDSNGVSAASNEVFAGVRELFRYLGLDAANYGTDSWNPLRDVVRPGDKVVVKLNLLWHAHKYRPHGWLQVISHGSVVRAVLDYVCLALEGHGEIWIADGPQRDAD